MATFNERIIDYTGSIPDGFELNGALYDGVLDVIEKVKAYYPHEIFKYTQALLLTQNGTDILDTGEPIRVERGGRECTEIASALKLNANTFGSIHYRTVEDPAFYVETGKVFTVPGVVSGEGGITSAEDEGGGLVRLNCSTNHNLEIGDRVVISTLSNDYEAGGALQDVVTIPETDAFTITATFTTGTITGVWTQNAGIVYLLKVGANVTALAQVSTIDGFPINRYNAVTLYASKRVLMAQITELLDSLSVIGDQYPADVVSFSLPDAPSVGTITTLADQTATIEMFVSPRQITLPDLPDIATDFNIDISNFTAPQFQQTPAPASPNFDNTTANLTDIQAPLYLRPILRDINYAKIISYINDTEDIELAQAQLQEGQAKIAEFQGFVQSENIAYQSKVEEYKTLVQEELTKIQHLNKVEVDDYTQKLSKYQADVANETQTFNAKLSKFNQEVQNHITSISTDHKINLDQYSAEVTSLMAKAQQDVNVENQRLQASIGKFNALVGQVGQDNKDVISKFSAEIQDYQAQAQSILGKFNADVQKHTAVVQKITAKYQNIVSEHQLKSGMLEQIRREYNEIFGILPQESKTPSEQRSK